MNLIRGRCQTFSPGSRAEEGGANLIRGGWVRKWRRGGPPLSEVKTLLIVDSHVWNFQILACPNCRKGKICISTKWPFYLWVSRNCNARTTLSQYEGNGIRVIVPNGSEALPSHPSEPHSLFYLVRRTLDLPFYFSLPYLLDIWPLLPADTCTFESTLH